MVQPGEEHDATAKADEQSEDYGDLEQAHPELGKVDKVEAAAITIGVQGRAASTKPQ